MAKKISIGGAVSSAINSKDFNLHEYKKSNNLVTNTKFKPQTYIPISEAFTEAISVEGIPTGQLTILRGHSDSGKAQPLFAKVLTPNGWTTIGQIEVGDEIIGSDGGLQTVLGVYPQGVRDVYKLSTSDGGSTLCDGEHLWSVSLFENRVRESKYSFKTMSTIDLIDTGVMNVENEKIYNFMLPKLSPIEYVEVDHLQYNPYKYRFISNIEYYGKEECVCIKVSNDDCLYVTDDFILTHNTTALLETAISCQKNGILPVFIITEMKWSWEHAISMGLEVTEHCDEDGVLFYDGFFIYADRSSLNTIEDVAAFINNRLKEQREGKLPYSLCFLWDSIGSIPCKLSVESNNNNNEWNAGAISAQFKNHVNQQIILSRKEGYPYINTLVCTNKIWVQKGTSYGEQPKLKNSGGESMFSDAALVITFGNVTSSGSSKIKAVKNGREVEFAKRIKISVDKNHITGITTTGRVVATSHGFIRDEKKDIDRYKKEYSSSWAKQLGSAEFDIVEEEYSTDDE